MRCATVRMRSRRAPRPPVVRLRHLRRPAARRHDRRQPRPHRRPQPGRRGPRRRARPGAAGPTPSSSRGSTRWRSGCSARVSGPGDRVGIWAPNVAEWAFVQYATAKIGAILVNINPAYRTHELEYVLNQSGVALLVAAPQLQDLRLRGDDRGGPAPLPRAAAGGAARLAGVGRAGRRPAGDRAELARVQASLSPDDPINIQYTSGTTGFPKGATLSHHNILNNGFFVGEPLRLHRGGPGLHPRALLPLLRHGHGQPRLHHARRDDGHPRARLRPGRDAARRRPGAVHLALRRADDVHRRAGRARLRLLRPVVAAHRDHGRLAVPGRGDEAGRRPDGHDRGDHLLRHDRDLAGVHPDPRRRHAGPARLDRRPGAPARRGQGRRPGDRDGRCPAASRASCAPAATR